MHARGGTLVFRRETWICQCESWACRCSIPISSSLQSSVTGWTWVKEAGPGFLSGAICVPSLFSSRSCPIVEVILFFEWMLWLLELKIQNTSWPNVELLKKLRKRATVNVMSRLFYYSCLHLSLSADWAWDLEFGLGFFPPSRRSDHLSGYSSLHFIISKLWNKVFFPLHKGAFFEISLSGKGEECYPAVAPWDLFVNTLV